MNKSPVGLLLVAILSVQPTPGAVIGVDAVHGYASTKILASGTDRDTFRSTITDLGHTIVPLTSFTSSDLAGLDGLIVKIAYIQNASPYTPDEMAAIKAFAQRAVFVSDSSMWADVTTVPNDRPITFGDNRLLLQNSISYIVTSGALFIGDDGSGFDVANFNQLVAPFGISYAHTPTDASGRTVSGFVPHPVTAGLTSIGVDFQLPMTVSNPAIDLTTGSGQDNVLAVSVVPEPTSFALLGLSSLAFVMARWRRQGARPNQTRTRQALVWRVLIEATLCLGPRKRKVGIIPEP